jgi:hypothetical protein
MKELRLKVNSQKDYNLLIHLAKHLGIEVEGIEDDEARDFASDSDAFDFWEDEREDVYTDLLK